MLGELLLAVECFKREIRLSDTPQYAWDLLGVTYFDLGWFAQSIEAHRQAINIEHDFSHAWLGLGKAYIGANSRSHALDVLQVLETLDPTKAEELHNMMLSQWRR